MALIPDIRLSHHRVTHNRLSMLRRESLLAGVALLIVLPIAAIPVAASAQDISSPSGSGGGFGGSSSRGNSYGYGGGLGSGVLPNAALGGSLVNLRDLVDSPITQAPTEAFTLGGSLGVAAGYTDNLRLVGAGASSKSGGSTFERVNPSLNTSADLNHLSATAVYAPSFYFYNSDSAANRSDQSLSANARATLVEDTLFVNASAFATQASTSQLNTYNGTNATSANNQTQVYTATINPYVVHQFADVASAMAGYSFSESYFDNSAQNQNQTKSVVAVPNNRSASQSEYFSVNSGSDFEFLQHSIQVRAVEFYGATSKETGHRDTANYVLSYAVNRFLTVFSSIGYQSLAYAPTSYNGVQVSRAYHANGMTGQAGLNYTPTEDSLLSMSYGRSDGGNSLTLSARMHPTQRIALIANSTTGVTTNGQDLANFSNASSASSDNAGRTGNGGAPLGYSLGTNASNPAPYRLTRSSASVIYALERDSFVASFSYSQQQNVAGVATTPIAGSVYTLGSLSWQHDVSDSISLSATANYGVQSTDATSRLPASSNPVVGGVVRLSNALTETISAEAVYIYAHQRVYGAINQGTKAETMNEVYFGLTKRF